MVGCETSSSGTDREAHEKESPKLDRTHRALERVEKIEQRAWHVFTSRFKGNITPGAGCDVCPKTCAVVDLRPMDTTAFQLAYRQMVVDLNTSHDDHVITVATHEHQRLLCLLRGGMSIRQALTPLFAADESSAVRYHAAIDAARLGFGTSEPKRVLHEVAEGSDFTAGLARLRIEKWNESGWPGE